ncbi:MAG TPA: hypothetical protein PKC38_02420, partial [Chitinophagales bacterium]|nr:hypothetical protein [Chitinophagales bacterium]
MKKLFTLLAAFSCLLGMKAQDAHQKDPFAKTFIQNTQRVPNQQLQATFRDAKAWENFRAAHGNWWVEFKEETGTPHRAYGQPIDVAGATPEDKAINFFETYCKDYIPTTQGLVLTSSNTTDKYHYVSFIQQYNGLDVLWSEATVRINMQGEVAMFGLDFYKGIGISTTPAIDAASIGAFATTGIDVPVLGTEVAPALKVLPIPGATGMEYKLVYEVTVHTANVNDIPGAYYTLVDANNGFVYYRANRVHACGEYLMGANIQINADITDNPLLATVNRGLPYLRVKVDGVNYYTDANGFLSLNTITAPTTARIYLRGLYARVSQGTGATNIDSADITVFPGDNVIQFDDEAGTVPSEVSAYYWQNIVHDHMKSYFPSFTDLDVDQLIRVERNDGSCNAFYDGTSTNFYQNGGGCPSTGLFNDVVMHEYGHGVNYDLYAALGDPGGMGNGAMQEGYADLWGITVTDNPVMGQGFLGGAGTFVRRYDAEPKVYPQDLVGEVHADGEIIAGAWWDVSENLGGDIESMTALWMETHNATVDGPSGSEGTIYTDVLIEALFADDDNGDLTDGTPNYNAIVEAFCEHGITMIGQVSTDHIGTFDFINSDEPISINVTIDFDYPTYVSDVKMYYKVNNDPSWTESVMTSVDAVNYVGEIAPQIAGSVISYYIQFSDINNCGGTVLPAEADLVDPNLPYFALVGAYQWHVEDFDNVFGSWEVDPFGTDDASTGEWDINTPIPSTDDVGYTVQTGEDHTVGDGNLCAFTGNAGEFDGVGTNDVDGGKTTLRSPFIDLTIYNDPIIVYYRKYSNDSPTSANPGNDVWQVYITDNGGDSWMKLERTYTSDNTWRRNAFRVKDYVDVTEDFGMIFIAQDSIDPSDPSGFLGGSLVEAAIDDMEIWDTRMPEVHVNDIETNSITVYPQPTNSYLNIVSDILISQVCLIDISGKIVSAESFDNLHLVSLEVGQ